MSYENWQRVKMTPELHEALTGLKGEVDAQHEPPQSSGHASDEIENDNEAPTAETRTYGTQGIDHLLMAYYNDPDTDYPDEDEYPVFTLRSPYGPGIPLRPDIPGPISDPPIDDIDDALGEIYGTLDRMTAASRPDSRAPVTRLAALLLGLCIVTGAAAFVAATGGGAGWAVGVFGVLMAVFGLGVVAGSNR